jgi:hypothetical protein
MRYSIQAITVILKIPAPRKIFYSCNGAFVIFKLSSAQNTDLSAPNSNLQTLPSGSYVIAMDNTLQLNSAVEFNLKAYGLIVYLLNNNVRIKWCIKTGKAKDGIDFTAQAEQVKPALIAGGTFRDFKQGRLLLMSWIQLVSARWWMHFARPMQ